MHRTCLTFLGLAAAFSLIAAHVVREAPNTDATFAELFEKAGNGLAEMQQVFLKALGVSSSEELNQKAIETGKLLMTKMDTWANNLKKETESLQENENVKSLRASVEKVINDLTKEHPKTAEEVKSLVETAKKQTDEVLGKLKTLGESEDAQKIKNVALELTNKTAETFQNIAKEFEENLKKQ